MLSASKLELATHCALPFSHLSPKWGDRVESVASALGTEVHELGEAIADGEEYDAEHDYAPAIEAAILELGPGLLAAEVPLAYDLDTGKARWLEVEGHRRYPKMHAREIPCTLDLLHISPDRILTVADHKTGRMARLHGVAETMQLRLCGLAAAAFFGADSVRVALIHLEAIGGEYVPDVESLELWDLDAVRQELRGIFAAIEAPMPQPNPGPWCRDAYCPCVAECPSTRAALLRAEQSTKMRLPVLGDIQTDEQCSAWRLGSRAIEEFLKDVKRKTSDYVKQNGPVHIGGDKWFGIVETEVERVSLEVPGAEDAVLAAFGTDAIEYTKPKTSKDAIEKLAKSRQSKRGEGVKAARALFDELRDLGAMQRTAYTSPREFTRKAEEE